MNENVNIDLRQEIKEPENADKQTKDDVTGTENPNPEKAEDEGPTLQEVIKEQATEDEAPLSSTLTLRKILGGDILSTSTIRHQIWLFLLIAFFMIIYTSNRYSCQQDLIEIDHLTKELQDAKYRALSSSSQITEKSRESNILEMLKNNEDSVLKIAKQPPYIINVPDQ
ncbi:MAG: hypothetical protein MSD82_06055 [Prevotella sp.]|nr:hypothetical protein [Prevotella sp.]